MEILLQDLRFAVRALRRHPAFSLTALATLVLGIGATTAVFSVVQAIVLKPLPFANPERIVAVETAWEKTGTRGPVSAPDFHDWERQAASFESLAFFQGGEIGVSSAASAGYGTVFMTSAGFFPSLGFTPQRGRLLLADDYRTGATPSAVITDAFWRSHFGGDAGALGTTIRVGPGSFTIVGILKPDMRYPARADVYFAAAASRIPENPNRSGHNYRVVGRVKPGVSVESSQAEMAVLMRRLAQQYPESNTGKGAAVTPLKELMVGQTRTTLYALLAAVSFVLLIACANVANLLLSRATARSREMALRAALGAGRGRLVRQLLTESAVLGIAAGTLGIAAAYAGVRALLAAAPRNLPRLDEVHVNETALGFTLLISLAASIIFGLAPAIRLSHVRLAGGLNAGRGAAAAVRRDWTRSGFVVAEIAFAVVLVTGAVLLGRSLIALASVDLGYQPERVLALRMAVPAFGPEGGRRATTFYRGLLEEVRTQPGVSAAGATRAVPTGISSNGAYTVEGRPDTRPLAERPMAIYSLITPDFFRTLRIPLARGRDFSTADTLDAPMVTVVNEAFARAAFGSDDPIGRRISIGFDRPGFMTIVGVAGNIRTAGPALPPQPEIYVPFEQHQAPATSMTLMVRTDADANALAATITRLSRARDPEVPVLVDTMNGALAQATATPRFRTYVLAVFASVALLLAVAGVYGVMTFNVSQRIAEIGLRLALGATSRDILSLIVGQGAKVVAVGIGAGVALSLSLSKLVSAFLFGITARDPVVLSAVVASVAAAAIVASAVPALAALRRDPIGALRSE